jgi:hypothetical protein
VTLVLPLLVLGIAIPARNWAGWANPLIDFGRELYVPWQLTQGKILYRDIAYLDGPLSPYLNALWFTILPVSLRTLEAVNLCIVGIASLLIFALMRRLGGRLVGFSSVAVFLMIFAFNRMGSGANMNWVAPYTHGMTHGITLALLALWFLSRYERSRGWRDLAGAGLAVGLAALTKPEVAAAAALAVAGGFAAVLAAQPSGERRAGRDLAALALSSAAPLLLAGALLALAMPPSEALAGALGGWPHALRSDVRSMQFYRWMRGIDDPHASLRVIWEFGRVWAGGLFAAFALSLVLRRRAHPGTWLAVGALLSLVVYGVLASMHWRDGFRPLTPFAAVFGLVAAADWWRSRSSPEAGRKALQLGFSLLALALLLKILLNARVASYGFGLALPAMLLVVLALLHSIPALVERWGGNGWAFRAASIVLLFAAGLGCLSVSEWNSSRKTVHIGSGGDHLRADRARRESRMMASLVGWVESNLPREASLLVLPEGVMVNYLTRRVNPTRHLNFVPPEILIFGEERILEDLRAQPPDYVVVVHRETGEYGLPLFGTHYAPRLLEWARESYQPVARVGAAPLVPERLEDRQKGFEVRRRRVTDPSPDEGRVSEQ